jgi:biopolymer transport protein ExbD
VKKFSRDAHHSLTELNITPLLDLAFVLLVIFIITTAPIVNDMELDLPTAAKQQKDPKPKSQYVAVDETGRMFLNREAIPSLALLQDRLVQLREDDPDLNVVVRGDARTPYRLVVGVLSVLQQANIGKVNLATDPVAQ